MEDIKLSYTKLSENIEIITRVDFEMWSNRSVIDNSAIHDPNGITIADTTNNGEIIEGGVLDKRLGVVGRIQECKTCGETPLKCPGHFGHIKLMEPVFHMGYISYVKNILSCICIRCTRLLVHKNENEIEKLLKNKNEKQRYADIKSLTKNITNCTRCGSPAHKISIDKKYGNVFILAEVIKRTTDTAELTEKKKIQQSLSPQLCYDILRTIPDEDCMIMGFNPKICRPESMIIKNFPVPPIQVRPSIKLETSTSSTSDDDLTHKLIDIIKTNENLKNAKGDGSLTKTASSYDDFMLLQIHVATFFDNQIIGLPKSLQKNKTVSKSLSERLKGKEGRVRGNLMGKRADQTARTVITPDPYIPTNGVGVPLIIAKNLTYPEIVTKQNIKYMTKIVENGNKIYPGANFVTKSIIDSDGHESKKVFHLKHRVNEQPIKLKIGDTVNRHLVDGDIIIFNRQPSLHKLSMMGHIVHVIPTKPDLHTFRLNVSATEPYNADYDGDEMNAHVPQCEQTRTELFLIANLDKRLINPKNSQIAIKIKQDALMGSYLITYDNMYIDWKNAMNILAGTSVRLNATIPKHKKISGKMLYSQIIQPNINISEKKPDGTYLMRVHNGEITDGKFASSEVQTIIQKTWRQYGSKETMHFIDDLQLVILKWLSIHGFTSSIQDFVVEKKIHQAVYDIIETKRKEVLTAITEYQNDPDIMTGEAFELTLEKGLAAIQDNIQKIIMNSFTMEGGANITVNSGSAATSLNLSQIIGAFGQIIVDRRRVLNKYNNRSLPMFHQYDNSAFARGFCASSFLKGLGPAEFFFNVMAGRDGVIATAIKTAATGYIQRKLVKILEDIKVEYDGTVRNANDKIIQCVYGDSGFNVEKQINIKIGLISADNKTVKDNYTYSTEELGNIRKKSDKYTSELNEKLYKKLITMRDQLRQIQKRINLTSMEFKESYMVPVDLQQHITNMINDPDRPKERDIVDPYYVLSKIKEMHSKNKIMKYSDKKNTIKKMDEAKMKFVLKCYLFDVINPKKCTHVHKLSTAEFDNLVDNFRITLAKAKIEPGEMVGCVAAHGIGEPVTQSNLKSFHKAGSGAAAAVSGGLPRVNELLSMSKTIKAPKMKIVLDDKYRNNKSIATKIASHLKYTVVKDVLEEISIVYDPNPNSKDSLAITDGVNNIFEVSKQKYGCQSDITGLPWVLRMVLSKEKMIERGINLLEFKTSFCYNWSVRHEDAKNSKKEYKKVIEKITQCAVVSSYDNSSIPIVHVRFDSKAYNKIAFIQFLKMVANKYQLKGLEGITESSNISEESYIDFDPSDGSVINKKQWVIYTEGVNLYDIIRINGINLNETDCNDIVKIYSMYGIEAVRAAFIREFTKAIESSGGYCNYQHIEILADAITHMGTLISVNRHGANKLDTDPFSRASFEKTVEQMLAAAAFGESDHIRSVSSRVMVGSLINGGTGCFDLLLDHEKVKKTLAPSKKVSEVKTIKKTTVVGDLIKKKANK